jgi:hypothetical protein
MDHSPHANSTAQQQSHSRLNQLQRAHNQLHHPHPQDVCGAPTATSKSQLSRLASNNSVRHDEQYPRALPSECTAACGISTVPPQCGQFAWSS